MKNIITLTYLSACFMLLIGFSSCEKVQGCTDPTANNYNSAAQKDNGSCIYNGSAIFWTAQADMLPQVTVTMADGTTGIITVDAVNGAPSCGTQGYFTYTAAPGQYSYNATDGSKTWNGNVTITSKGCFTLQLTP